MKGETQIRTGGKGFANLRLTTWLYLQFVAVKCKFIRKFLKTLKKILEAPNFTSLKKVIAAAYKSSHTVFFF